HLHNYTFDFNKNIILIYYMKQHFPLLNTSFLVLILLIVGISCKKNPNTPEPTPEEIASKQLEEDADYNNSVLQGAGNIYLENQLAAGSTSQLLAKQVFRADTIGYFANINSSS